MSVTTHNTLTHSNQNETQNSQEDTIALTQAVNSLSPDRVKALLAKGVSPKILMSNIKNPNIKEQTLLFLAISAYSYFARCSVGVGYDEALEVKLLTTLTLLLDAGVDINHQNSVGRTVLMQIFCEDFNSRTPLLKVCQFLVEKGCDINLLTGESTYNALNYALKEKNIECAQYLVEQKSDINLFSSTSLFYFENTMMFWIKTAPTLCADKPKSTAEDSKEDQSIEHRIKQNQSFFKALVQAGADLNAVTKSLSPQYICPQSTLSFALQKRTRNDKNRDALIKLLIEHKADPFLENEVDPAFIVNKHPNKHPKSMSFFEELLLLSEHNLIAYITEHHSTQVFHPSRTNETFMNMSAYGHCQAVQTLLETREVSREVLEDAFTRLGTQNVPQHGIGKFVPARFNSFLEHNPFGMRRTFLDDKEKFRHLWFSLGDPLLRNLDRARFRARSTVLLPEDRLHTFDICEQIQRCLQNLTNITHLFLKHIDLSDLTKYSLVLGRFVSSYSNLLINSPRVLDGDPASKCLEKILCTAADLTVGYLLLKEWIKRQHIELLDTHMKKAQNGEKENKLDTLLFLDHPDKRAAFTTLLKENKIIKERGLEDFIGPIVELFYNHQAPYHVVMSKTIDKNQPKFLRLSPSLCAKVLEFFNPAPHSNNPSLLKMYHRQTVDRLNYVAQQKERAKISNTSAT